MNRALAHFTIELTGTEEQLEADAQTSCTALWRLVDAAVRRWAPMALEADGRVDDATELRGLPVVTGETREKTRHVLNRFLEDASPPTPGTLAAMQAALAISSACDAESGRKSETLSANYVVHVLGGAAQMAARCANYAGEAARADARRLVAELSAGFKG